MPFEYFAVVPIFRDRFRNHPAELVEAKRLMQEMRGVLQGNLDLQLRRDLRHSTKCEQSNPALAAIRLRLRFDLHCIAPRERVQDSQQLLRAAARNLANQSCNPKHLIEVNDSAGTKFAATFVMEMIDNQDVHA